MGQIFSKIAGNIAEAIGTPWAFTVALLILIIWAISGPILKFSDTWQLIINTSTTIITFLTVFLIQHTQNKNDRATQLKLDEIIHSIRSARNDFIDLEDADEETLKKLREEYKNKKNKLIGNKKKH